MTNRYRHLISHAVAGAVGALVCIACVRGVPSSNAEDNSAPTVIKAHSFELVDDQGNLRGVWKFSESGMANLHMYGKKASAHLGFTDEDNSILLLESGEKDKYISLTVDPLAGEEPMLSVQNSPQNSVSIAPGSVTVTGASTVTRHDDHSFGVMTEKLASLALFGTIPKEITAKANIQGSLSGIILLDDKGQIKWKQF